MARLFDDASSQYLSIGSAPVTAYPLTMAGWFHVDVSNINQVLVQVYDADNNNEHTLYIDDVAIVSYRCRDSGGENSADATTTIATGGWHHAAAVGTNSTDRAVYYDGGNKGTSAIARTPVTLDSTTIASWKKSFWHLSGRAGEIGIWSAALSDSEVASLAAGYSPLLIRPASLVAYWPLIRDTDNDIVGGYNMTAYNSPTIAAHPPVTKVNGLYHLDYPEPTGPTLAIFNPHSGVPV